MDEIPPCNHATLQENYFIPNISPPRDNRIVLCSCRIVVKQDSDIDIPIYCMICTIPFYQKNVYKCEKGHLICGACRYFDLINCKEDGTPLVEANVEKSILLNLMYECRWRCTAYHFNFLDCHHAECTSQPIRKCPVSTCENSGILRDIFNHYQETHSWDNIKVYDYWMAQPNGNGGVYLLADISNNKEWHYLVSNVFVTIKREEMENGYKFDMIIGEETKLHQRVCAFIKFGDQSSQKVLDTFTVPKSTKCIYIRVFF